MPDGDFHLATLSLSQSHSAVPSGLDLYDAGSPTLKQLGYYHVVPPGLHFFGVF